MSWVIRRKATGEVITETSSRKFVIAINREKYEVVPIREYLASLNAPPASDDAKVYPFKFQRW